MNKLISIIIPVYNVEKYLEKCILSVINQTYKNIEIILVNDGSPDNSIEICKKYARIDSRIIYIEKENGGLSSARNVGIDVAKGEYIGFVDSDDYISSDMYEKLYDIISSENADMAICNLNWVDENGKTLDGHISPIKDEVCSQKDIFEKFLSNNYFYYVTAVNRLYAKHLFTNIRFPEGKLHEDEFTAHLFYDKCDKVVCCSESLYFYVQRQSSIMNKSFSVKRLDAAEAIIKRTNFFIEKGYNNIALHTLYGIVYVLGVASVKLQDETSKKTVAQYKEKARNLYHMLNKKEKLSLIKTIECELFFRDSKLFSLIYKFILDRK